MEPAGTYHAQFHWHEGEGRLTLDHVKNNRLLRALVGIQPLCLHCLPYLLEPVFRAWQTERPRHGTPSGNRKHVGGLCLQDFHPVIQAQYMGVQFMETGEWSLEERNPIVEP